MKEEDFIVGKWYKLIDYNLYIKFSHINHYKVFYTEQVRLHSKSIPLYREIKSWANISNNFQLINISEIAHLLPKNHPDLQYIERNYELW